MVFVSTFPSSYSSSNFSHVLPTTQNDDLFLFYFMCHHVLPACVDVYHLCAASMEARREW